MRRLDSDYSEIISGKLWIGSAPSYDDLAKLKEKLGPTSVVIDLNRNPREAQSCKELGVNYDDRTPQMDDSSSQIPISRLRLVSRLIDEHIQNGRQVYLHCTAGRGRSPTCAAAYLIHSGMSLSEAKTMITRKRHVWEGKDANYAISLDEFAEMQEIADLSKPDPV